MSVEWAKLILPVAETIERNGETLYQLMGCDNWLTEDEFTGLASAVDAEDEDD